MQSITLPEGLQYIGGLAFHECTALQSITSRAATPPAIDTDQDIFEKITYATATLTVPEGAEAAYRAAENWGWFYNTTQDGITYGLHDSGQSAMAFYAEEGITAADIPATVNIDGTEYPVTAIGEGAFYHHTALESVTLAKGLQYIDYYAFFECTALQSVILPEGLQSIGDYAFAYCPLQSIVLPEGLQTIGDNAFESTTLQSVVLPEELQSIGNGAFYWCLALESVTLPSTLQSLGGGAFLDCPLKDVTSLAAVPPVMEEGDAFDEDTYATATLHVPSNAVGDYQAAEYWKQFLNIEGNLPPVGIGSVAADAPLAIYANDVITTASPATITVYAQSGARVMRAADATQLSLEALPRGIYIIDVEAGTERQVMKVAH